MKKGMGLLSALLGKKMENGMDGGESSVSITIGKEMENGEKESPEEMMRGGMTKYAKGGRIDGCAIKGKTKGSYR